MTWHSNRFFFYTNIDFLRRVLATHDISINYTGGNSINKSLSTVIPGYFMIFTKRPELELLNQYCLSNAFDTIIEIEISLSLNDEVKIIDDSSVERTDFISSITQNDNLVLIDSCISIFNIISISGVNKNIEFTNLDMNFNIPYNLILKNEYNSEMIYKDILSKYIILDNNDDDDDILNDGIFSDEFEVDDVINENIIYINEKLLLKEKILAGLTSYAYSINNDTLKLNNINSDIYYILEKKDGFGDYIKKKIYKTFDEHCIEKYNNLSFFTKKVYDSLINKVNKNPKKLKNPNLLDLTSIFLINQGYEKSKDINKLNFIGNYLEFLNKFNSNYYNDMKKLFDSNQIRTLIHKLDLNNDTKDMAAIYYYFNYCNNNYSQNARNIDDFSLSIETNSLINMFYGLTFGMYVLPNYVKTNYEYIETINNKIIKLFKLNKMSNDNRSVLVKSSNNTLKSGFNVAFYDIVYEKKMVETSYALNSIDLSIIDKYLNFDSEGRMLFQEIKKYALNRNIKLNEILSDNNKIHKEFLKIYESKAGDLSD